MFVAEKVLQTILDRVLSGLPPKMMWISLSPDKSRLGFRFAGRRSSGNIKDNCLQKLKNMKV